MSTIPLSISSKSPPPPPPPPPPSVIHANLSSHELNKNATLLQWLDTVPFTKPKKNITRDFSDGVLMAELISHYFPKMIELHNYTAANGANLKKNNWELLNRKVLPKLGIKLPEGTIEGICHAKSGYIEPILIQIKKLLAKKHEQDEIAKELANCSGDGVAQALQEDSCMVHILPNDIPEFVIYKGGKFVPEEMLNDSEKSNVELKIKVREFSQKVQRLETLIKLKESHLGDLTKQVHEMRLKLGEINRDHSVCQWENGEEPANPSIF